MTSAYEQIVTNSYGEDYMMSARYGMGQDVSHKVSRCVYKNAVGR